MGTDQPVRGRAYGDFLVRMPAGRKHSGCSAVTGNRANAAAGRRVHAVGAGEPLVAKTGAFGRDQAVPDAVLDPCDSAVTTAPGSRREPGRPAGTPTVIARPGAQTATASAGALFAARTNARSMPRLRRVAAASAAG